MPQPELSTAEWRAVAIALRDAADCGCPHERAGAIARLYRALTGNRPATMPADPRLEAVRRFVCATHRAGRAADDLAPALAGHGFNDRQIEALALLAA